MLHALWVVLTGGFAMFAAIVIGVWIGDEPYF